MGTKKVSILPQSPSPCFLNPMNSRMKPVKTFKLSANFLSLFVITNLSKQNHLSFLTVNMQGVSKQVSFSRPLEAKQQGIHNHFRVTECDCTCEILKFHPLTISLR